MMNNLSKNLRFLRRRNGFSQQELADKIGILRSTLAAYESKNVEPRIESLVQISLILGVEIHELLLADLEKKFAANAENGASKNSKSTLIKKFDHLQSLLENQKRMMELKWKQSGQLSPEVQKAVAEMDNFVLLSDQFSQLSKELIEQLSD